MRTNLSELLLPTLIVVLLSTGSYVSSQTAPTPSPQVCTACGGTVKVRCNGGCANGKTICPAPCLKLSVGKWEKIPGTQHGADALWQKFMYRVGTETHYYGVWEGHCGDIVVYENGKPVHKGHCPTCGGTQKVDCTRCGGTGTTLCPKCGVIALQPDGTTIIGSIVMQGKSQVMIKTTNGERLTILRTQLKHQPNPLSK